MDLLAYIKAAAHQQRAAPRAWAYPTPFAQPPAVGLSRPRTHVGWGALSLAVGAALITGVGDFRLGAILNTAAVAVVAVLVGFGVARSAARARRRREAAGGEHT